MELSAVAKESRRDFLPLCEKYNIGVIAFSTTGSGILTGRFNKESKFEPQDIRNFDPLFQYEKLESSSRIYDKFKELSQKYNKTPVQIAIYWFLCQRNIISCLVDPLLLNILKKCSSNCI